MYMHAMICRNIMYMYNFIAICVYYVHSVCMCGVQHNTTILLCMSMSSAMNQKEIARISSSKKLLDESIILLYIHIIQKKSHFCLQYTKDTDNADRD